ncbi:hypothetical protein SLS56_010339 [Neofusicoccum ribis]|uniref:Zn(2)-C6 fungal-type domain-containing protein n=1 Tax=Neofusicoccum ribis TaxID=45134 RepID=A0ABR3SF59_9PEZI
MASFASAPFPPDLNPRPKKKRRPALSCVTCRDRKLKCDKERPRCGRCVQTGPDQPCIYLETPARRPQTTHQQQPWPGGAPPSYVASQPSRAIREFDPTPASSRSPLEDATRPSEPPNLESRLARLEKILVQAIDQSAIGTLYDDAAAAKATPPLDASPPEIPAGVPKLPPVHRSEHEEILVYPGSYRGYGLSHPAMLVCKFVEMPAFMVRIRAEHPVKTQQLKQRIEGWRATNMDSRDLWSAECGFTSAIASLPPKESLDRLVFAYFDLFELEYPILDERKFISVYESAWEGHRFSPSPQLLMTLLLVVATTVNIYAANLPDPDPILEAGKKNLRRYIHLSERWLVSRGTSLPDLDSVRLYCLLVLAKRYNGFPRDQIWTTAGSLVRTSMLCGLHAQAWQPGSEQDGCRTLWTTVLELDLLTSIDSGMIPSVPIAEFTRVSRAEERRRQKPQASRSGASTQGEMVLSLGLRVEICCMLNSNTPEPTGPKTAEQEEKLKQHMSSLTSAAHHLSGTSASSDRQAHWIELSRAKLQKYLLMIYLPYALEGPLQTRFPHHKKTCVEIAVTILSDHQARLDGANYSVCLKIDDAFQAAMAVCHEIYQPVQPGIPSLAQLPGYVSVLKPLLKSGLDILTQRLLHVGHWHGEYFLLCLAIGLCQIKTWPNKMSEYAKEVVDMLEESCTFITTPKTPSTMSPAASHTRQQSLATPAQPTPHVSAAQQSPLDVSAEKDLFAGLDTVSESFQDIIEFLGLSYPLDSLDPGLDTSRNSTWG